MHSLKGNFEYRIVRSSRRTLSLIVRPHQVTVRAPYAESEENIVRFVEEHAGWVVRKLEEAGAREEAARQFPVLSQAGLRKLHAKAVSYIPQRVAFFAPVVGVTYGKITFRIYKSRWGSCKADGSLSFNTLLMLAPPDVIDSVVVHELCHRKVMDHSPRFYREVLRVCPDYDRKHRWLRDNRDRIMAAGGLVI